jgi:putative IMPACT (imprinted ancient) family translation regulator
MIKTLTIKEAAAMLNYKDIRSLEKWCNENGVEIFSEEGTRNRYLIRSQFEYAKERPIIQYLKLKYKNNWLVAFKAHMDAMHLAEFEENNQKRRV